jgi:CheY-like chemotaxis protein
MLTSVYIIDDDPIDCLIAQKIISSSCEHCDLTLFHSPTKALEALKELARENPSAFPHGIFLDINMPLMNGFTFLDHFMLLPAQVIKETSIFMLSSSISAEDISKAMDYKVVNTYFSKPLTSKVLEATLKKKHEPFFKQYLRS